MNGLFVKDKIPCSDLGTIPNSRSFRLHQAFKTKQPAARVSGKPVRDHWAVVA